MPGGHEREILERAFAAAVAAVEPEHLVREAVTTITQHGPAIVLGAGKAAAAMAAAFRAHWRGPARGLVVTRYEHGLKAGEDAGDIEIVEAGHPSPDAASIAAGRRLLELAASHAGDEQLFFLASGGGSALAAVPLDGIRYEDKRDAANHLMHSGAAIGEINCVRKHLSALKGGRLARLAHPAPVTTWAISDVPGDRIEDIGSGPTIPDPGTLSAAIAILRRYDYPRLDELLPVLTNPANETPKPDDPGFAGDHAALIGTAAKAFAAARQALEACGYEVMFLGDDLDADAAALGQQHAELALKEQQAGRRLAILSGGETRVTIKRTDGRGGRNLVYLGGLALALQGQPGIYALAADTDGIDGQGGHAGGVILPTSIAAGMQLGVSLEACLQQHDSYTFFDTCDLLVTTGPTRTNVNDFRLILCHP